MAEEDTDPIDPSEFVDGYDSEAEPVSDEEDLPIVASAKAVKLASGADYEVMHETEAQIVNNLVQRYTTEYLFSSISDLQDVDRIIIMELMAHRYSGWQNRGHDYYGQEIDNKDLDERILNASKEVRQIKKALGIDRLTRDKDKGDSVPEYLENLRVRARQFGLMREKQLDVALSKFQKLSGLTTLYWNCTDIERKEEKCTAEDILKWLRDEAIPEFNEIDEYFQEHEQRYWVREN